MIKFKGIVDTNDGIFGGVFDGNNDKIIDIIPSGDCETTIQSLKTDDIKINDDLPTKLSPYLEFFRFVRNNYTGFENVVFKVLAENGCPLITIDSIDHDY